MSRGREFIIWTTISKTQMPTVKFRCRCEPVIERDHDAFDPFGDKEQAASDLETVVHAVVEKDLIRQNAPQEAKDTIHAVVHQTLKGAPSSIEQPDLQPLVDAINSGAPVKKILQEAKIAVEDVKTEIKSVIPPPPPPPPKSLTQAVEIAHATVDTLLDAKGNIPERTRETIHDQLQDSMRTGGEALDLLEAVVSGAPAPVIIEAAVSAVEATSVSPPPPPPPPPPNPANVLKMAHDAVDNVLDAAGNVPENARENIHRGIQESIENGGYASNLVDAVASGAPTPVITDSAVNAVEALIAPPPPDSGDVLSEIRSGNFNLKKVDRTQEKSVKSEARPGDVLSEIRSGNFNLKKVDRTQEKSVKSEAGPKDILSEIRAGNFNLKKVDTTQEPPAKPPAKPELEGPFADMAKKIDSMRAAIVGQDDDSDKDDDKNWEGGKRRHTRKISKIRGAKRSSGRRKMSARRTQSRRSSRSTRKKYGGGTYVNEAVRFFLSS